MTRLLILVTVGVVLGTLAVLAFLPSLGHAGDQQGVDLADVTLVIRDVDAPAMSEGAFQAELTGPFRRAAVKADLVRDDRITQCQRDLHTSMPVPPATIATSELPFRARRADVESDERCSLKASAVSPQPASGIAETTEPVAAPYSLALAITRDTDPSSAAPSQPAVTGDAKSEAASSTDAGVVTGPVNVAVAPGARGPYPQCRYLGCSGPLACRECVCCEEIQHYGYYPAMHGNYYFIPYNAIKVPFQQAFVARFGGDPRVPYANGVFQTVYAAYRAAHPAPASDLPATTRPEEVPPPETSKPSQEAE
jgi:hypothetical protein